jgi:hypothetical protein
LIKVCLWRTWYVYIFGVIFQWECWKVSMKMLGSYHQICLFYTHCTVDTAPSGIPSPAQFKGNSLLCAL